MHSTNFSQQDPIGNVPLRDWLGSLPTESIDRLRQINTNTGSAHHVILTLAFGIRDRNIGKLNRMIAGLLVRRMKAERAGRHQQVERINAYMQEMHDAIDAITGVNSATNGNRSNCNRIKGSRKYSGITQ